MLGKFAILMLVFLAPIHSTHGIVSIRNHSQILWKSSGFKEGYDVLFKSCDELNVVEEEPEWPYEEKWTYYQSHFEDQIEKKRRERKKCALMPMDEYDEREFREKIPEYLSQLYEMLPEKAPDPPKPRFCSKKKIKDEEWKRPFVKAFTDLQDFYDPYRSSAAYPQLFESVLVRTFLNAFIDTQVGRKIYGMVMVDDPEEAKGYHRVLSYISKTQHYVKTLAEYMMSDDDDFAEPLTGPQRKKLFNRLKLMWFGSTKYKPRDRRIGFRHVFVGHRDRAASYYGEVQVIRGLNNWYQFYRLLCVKDNQRVKDGEYYFRYQLHPLPRQFFGNPQPSEVKFCRVGINWNSVEREGFSTILMGSRPEYDFAIFTLCFHEYVVDHVVSSRRGDKISGLCSSHLGSSNAPVQVYGDLSDYEYNTYGNSRLRSAFFRV